MSAYRSGISRGVVAFSAGAIALVLVGACGSSGTASDTSSAGGRDASGLVKIKIGVAAPTAEQALPQVAQDLGFFKEHGIDANITLIPGGPQITAGLVGGSLNFGVYSAPAPEVAAVQGASIKYVGVWTHRSNLGLVVAPGINSVQDLKGKAVAVSAPGTTTAIYTDTMLRDAGLNSTSDVVRRNVGGQGAALSAFASGQVKAAIFGAPVTYSAVSKTPGSKILIDYSKQDYAWPYAGIVATNSYAAKNSQTVVKVLAALKEAAKAYQDPTKTSSILPIIAKFTSTTSQTAVKQSFDLAAKDIDVSLVPVAADHQDVLTQLALTTPQAKGFAPTKMFDSTYAEQASGK
jgi:ABC-type nitrate/sulfonate/bicarbonate transport system substrate-binding protein